MYHAADLKNFVLETRSHVFMLSEFHDSNEGETEVILCNFLT
jgi:hypothetical protein